MLCTAKSPHTVLFTTKTRGPDSPYHKRTNNNYDKISTTKQFNYQHRHLYKFPIQLSAFTHVYNFGISISSDFLFWVPAASPAYKFISLSNQNTNSAQSKFDPTRLWRAAFSSYPFSIKLVSSISSPLHLNYLYILCISTSFISVYICLRFPVEVERSQLSVIFSRFICCF